MVQWWFSLSQRLVLIFLTLLAIAMVSESVQAGAPRAKAQTERTPQRNSLVNATGQRRSQTQETATANVAKRTTGEKGSGDSQTNTTAESPQPNNALPNQVSVEAKEKAQLEKVDKRSDETVTNYLPLWHETLNKVTFYAFVAFAAFFLLFYFVIPGCLLAKTPRQDRPKYKDWLLDFSHLFFTGVAFLVAAVIAVVLFNLVFLVGDLHSRLHAQALDPDQASRVLSLAETMFGFFGLVLAAATAIAGVFGYWLRHSVQEAIEKSDKIEKRLAETLTTTNYDFILSADLALTHLPEVTFSQQIPMSLLGTLKLLHNVFEKQDREGHLWKTLVNSENGSRIRYARALYLLGTEPSRVGDPSEESLTSPDHPVTVVQLLKDASRKLGGDRALRRDILIRLFQAYRQIPRFEDADKTLAELKKKAGEGEDIAILSSWAHVVLFLQQGFYALSNRREPKEAFGLAVEHADELFGRLFPAGKYEGRDAMGAAAAYYCAKAYWAHRFCFDKEIKANQATLTLSALQGYATRFEKAAEQADSLLDKVGKGISDGYTSAIYYSSRAYLLVARQHYPGVNHPYKSSDDFLAEVEKLVKKARSQLQTGAEQARSEFGDAPIYNDHTECLDNLARFDSYLTKIVGFAKDVEKMRKFYAGEFDARNAGESDAQND